MCNQTTYGQQHNLQHVTSQNNNDGSKNHQHKKSANAVGLVSMIYGEEVVEQVSFDLGLMDDENDESENGEIVWKVALV